MHSFGLLPTAPQDCYSPHMVEDIRISTASVVSLFILCVIALWLRLPLIGSGLPYFYNEDEAHHFNRTVQMVKEGRLDPEYFHKPSLHFYLRMPIVAAGFIDGVRKGYLKSIKEVRARNPYGLGGYAFTSSHPGIVKWNRTFSVLLSVLVVVFTFCVASALAGSGTAGILAAGLVAISPDMIFHSATIGVDVVMTVMCIWATYICVRLKDRFTLAQLCAAGLLCGLAVSSKYNALPIAILPVTVCLFRLRIGLAELGIAVFAPMLGFLLGSPYILAHIPLFLDQLAYEVWHYGIAGHVGHSAEPGLDQAVFYGKWLISSAVGAAAMAACSIGIISCLVRPRAERIAFLVFPVLFAVLMISQKANFTRNMVVIIPFIAVLAALGVDSVRRLITSEEGTISLLFHVAMLAVICYFPAESALSVRHEAGAIDDSRRAVVDFLKMNSIEGDTAVAGQLQLPLSIILKKGISVYDAQEDTAVDAYLQGYQRIVIGNTEAAAERAVYLESIINFVGQPGKQRIVKNPAVEVLSIVEGKPLTNAALTRIRRDDRYTLRLTPAVEDKKLSKSGHLACKGSAESADLSEEHCWLNSRLTRLVFDKVASVAPAATESFLLKFDVMTPWEGQELGLLLNGKAHELSLDGAQPGQWRSLALALDREMLQGRGEIIFALKEIHSPRDRSISTDPRRLGLACKNFYLTSHR